LQNSLANIVDRHVLQDMDSMDVEGELVGVWDCWGCGGFERGQAAEVFDLAWDAWDCAVLEAGVEQPVDLLLVLLLG
jgi:hypothetical protein